MMGKKVKKAKAEEKEHSKVESCYTLEQVAKLLHTNLARVKELIANGKLKAININSNGQYKKYRVSNISYEEFLKKGSKIQR